MQTISIIGAGISGLALGQCLKDEFHVKIFEQASKPGGLIQCDKVEGNLFHKVGGHVFNAKDKTVSDWFWSFFDKENEFILTKRNAKIWLDGHFIGYPIEDHLYQLEKNFSKRIIHDLLIRNKEEAGLITDFESFLIHNFGQTLYECYFKPYNMKIWKTDLSSVPLEWLEGKLPMPDLTSIICNNIYREEENVMVHSNFYYPKEGGSQFIADRLAQKLDISFCTPVTHIEKRKNHYLLNGEFKSDKLIYTGDVRKLGNVLNIDDPEIESALEGVKHLRSNGTSNVLCECDPGELSWLYLPEAHTQAHRIIYTGNFSPLNNAVEKRPTCVVEFSGKVPIDIMEEEIQMLPGNLISLSHNYESNSYVIQDHESRSKIAHLKQLLESNHFYLLGRFAEWEYYNMDKAMEASMKLQKHLSFDRGLST